MKYLVILATVLLLVACGAEQKAAVEPRLEDLRGHWLVINYWAQWCKPCIEEIPELNALDARRDDVRVLGVNFDGTTGDELAAQEQRLGVSFPTLSIDPFAQLGVPRPVVLPTTLVVDPGGAVVAKLVGPQTLASLEEAITSAQD